MSLGIGERLIQAREERGLSLEDAERDTRISRRYLQALEDETFDIIPAPVYARGFLRSYTQYLGLDTARMLARFPEQAPAGGAPAPRTPGGEQPPARGRSSLFGSSLPDEPMIGVDIGVAVPSRRLGSGSLSFARTGLVASVAIGVVAVVLIIAILIANLGGGGETPAVEGGTTPTATPSGEGETPATSGLDVRRGVVPDLIGQPEDIARLAVEEAGFEVTVVRGRNEQYPRGTVFEQAPTAGVEQEPGRGVFIAVSDGP